MTAIRASSGDAHPEVVAAWANRCRVAGVDPRHCFGPESGYLLSALHTALAEDAATADLGRAARSWGATFSAPVEALVSLSALRDVFIASIPADRYELVGEHMVREAVDAASNRLRAEARTDSLTGCANRFALSEDLARTVSSASRSGVDVSVAMVDLNGLKAINDTRGHVAGDLALQSLVENLSAVLRDADTLYRFGGDEFVVIAPFTDIAGAVAMLERAALREPRFSWGIASLATVGAQAVAYPEMLVSAADGDLYRRRSAVTLDPAIVPSPVRERSRARDVSGSLVVLAGVMTASLTAAWGATAGGFTSARGAIAAAFATASRATARRAGLIMAASRASRGWGQLTSAVGTVRTSARRRSLAISLVAVPVVVILAAVLGLTAALGHLPTSGHNLAFGPSGAPQTTAGSSGAGGADGAGSGKSGGAGGGSANHGGSGGAGAAHGGGGGSGAGTSTGRNGSSGSGPGAGSGGSTNRGSGGRPGVTSTTSRGPGGTIANPVSFSSSPGGTTTTTSAPPTRSHPSPPPTSTPPPTAVVTVAPVSGTGTGTTGHGHGHGGTRKHAKGHGGTRKHASHDTGGAKNKAHGKAHGRGHSHTNGRGRATHGHTAHLRHHARHARRH